MLTKKSNNKRQHIHAYINDKKKIHNMC